MGSPVTSVRRLAVLVAAVAIGSGCGPKKPQPLELVDRATRAVYSGDYNGTRRLFDDALRPSVTPASVSALSLRMHRYGGYRGVTLVSEIAPKRRYDFEAAFERGSMLVQVRFDPDGTFAAYRVIPNEAAARR